MSVVCTVPKKGLAKEKEEQLKQKLQAIKDSLSKKELEQLVKNTEALQEYQDMEDYGYFQLLILLRGQWTYLHLHDIAFQFSCLQVETQGTGCGIVSTQLHVRIFLSSLVVEFDEAFGQLAGRNERGVALDGWYILHLVARRGGRVAWQLKDVVGICIKLERCLSIRHKHIVVCP